MERRNPWIAKSKLTLKCFPKSQNVTFLDIYYVYLDQRKLLRKGANERIKFTLKQYM